MPKKPPKKKEMESELNDFFRKAEPSFNIKWSKLSEEDLLTLISILADNEKMMSLFTNADIDDKIDKAAGFMKENKPIRNWLSKRPIIGLLK